MILRRRDQKQAETVSSGHSNEEEKGGMKREEAKGKEREKKEEVISLVEGRKEPRVKFRVSFFFFFSPDYGKSITSIVTLEMNHPYSTVHLLFILILLILYVVMHYFTHTME